MLFPILDELLKSADPSLGETKLRASNLLCKVFLADVGRFSETQSEEMVVGLFGRVLGVMERMIRTERDGMVGNSLHQTHPSVKYQGTSSSLIGRKHGCAKYD